MTTLRTTDRDRTYGYGVDGFSSPISGQQLIFAVENYIADIPLNLSPLNGEDIERFLISMRWRVSVQTTNFGGFDQKIFNAKIGRGVFGEYAVAYREYFTDSGFVSFQTFLSELYYCQFMFEVGPDMEQILPCNEPQDNLGVSVTINFPIINAASSPALPGYNQSAAQNLGARKPVNIGASFIYEPAYPTQEYIAGITYEYTVTYYTAGVTLEQNPINIGI